MPGPIATIGSVHVCPMSDGPKPHVGGPVIGPGAPNILINGKPAALMGDLCTCIGPPNVIAQGAANVFFNGVPVACQGDMTAHGGIITVGEANVIVGSATPSPSQTMPLEKIPFPEITLMSKFMGNNKEAEANQEQLKKEAQNKEGEPRIFNLQWVKEEKITRKSTVVTKTYLRASTVNFEDGEEVNFTLTLPQEKTGGEPKIVTLSGTVKDRQVEVEWETEEKDEQSNT